MYHYLYAIWYGFALCTITCMLYLPVLSFTHTYFVQLTLYIFFLANFWFILVGAKILFSNLTQNEMNYASEFKFNGTRFHNLWIIDIMFPTSDVLAQSVIKDLRNTETSHTIPPISP